MNAISQTAERTRCEVWTRVMGYHRPVSYFNPGKKSEHYSRKHFEECVAANQEFRIKFGTSHA
jgi:hypothetical protein